MSLNRHATVFAPWHFEFGAWDHLHLERAAWETGRRHGFLQIAPRDGCFGNDRRKLAAYATGYAIGSDERDRFDRFPFPQLGQVDLAELAAREAAK